MFGECHAHIIMDGQNYRRAVDLHKDGVQDEAIRAHFACYREQGITFVRDGGDAAGVSARARELAPEYDIDYRTPLFAIHQNGHYGGIVGLGFDDVREYHALVLKAKREGADFIKIMTTGILDFDREGKITGTALDPMLVKEMVHIAHEEGMAVMSHTNGAEAIKTALDAGVDSLEHGNFMDGDALLQLAASDTVWVPTLVTVRNLLGCGRYPDDTIRNLQEQAAGNIKRAFALGACAALGSDAGAYMVGHGTGLVDEYRAFLTILGDTPEVKAWLEKGEKRIREVFRR